MVSDGVLADEVDEGGAVVAAVVVAGGLLPVVETGIDEGVDDPLSIALSWADQVVAACGQPTPRPLKF